MLAAFDVTHAERESVAATTAAKSVWPLRSRLESPPLPCATRPDVPRCLSGKPHVRPSRVVPDHVQTKLTTHRSERRRNKKASRAFLFHRPDEPFDDRDARRFADPTVSRSDVPTLAPSLETTAPELRALVRDDIAGMLAVCASGSVEEALHLDRRGALLKDRESHADPGKLIDRHRNPPAERPALRQREGKPRHPESGAGRYGREIDVPCVPRIPGNNSSPPPLGLGLILGRSTALPDHPPYRGCAEVQPGSGEHLSHALVSDLREESFQLTDEIPNEVRITVDGLDGLNQVSLAMLVDATHPDLQGLQVNQKDPDGLLQRPTPGCTELQDSHALGWRVVRTSPGSRTLPAAILDAQFLAKQRDFRGGLLELCAESPPTGCLAPGVGQGYARQRDRVEHARLDVLRPWSTPALTCFDHCFGSRIGR